MRTWACLAAGLTLLLLTAFVGFVRLRVKPLPSGEQIREAERHGHAERLRDIPSVRNQPPIEQMKLEEALILEEIGDVFPRGQKQWKPWHPPNQTSTFAQEIDYWLEYVPKDIHGSGITGDAPITVTVEKFANEAWPLYFAKWSPSPDLLPEQNRDLFLTRVSKFDNRVVMDRQFRLPDDTGKLWFFWPSGKNLISVIDSSKEIHEEILRRYLEKYPSSLR